MYEWREVSKCFTLALDTLKAINARRVTSLIDDLLSFLTHFHIFII